LALHDLPEASSRFDAHGSIQTGHYRLDYREMTFYLSVDVAGKDLGTGQEENGCRGLATWPGQGGEPDREDICSHVPTGRDCMG
jgi:hypothetical protein